MDGSVTGSSLVLASLRQIEMDVVRVGLEFVLLKNLFIYLLLKLNTLSSHRYYLIKSTSLISLNKTTK